MATVDVKGLKVEVIRQIVCNFPLVMVMHCNNVSILSRF